MIKFRPLSQLNHSFTRYELLQPNKFIMTEIYYEQLPEGCPEDDAKPANNQKFYRLINGNTANDVDFYSHKKLEIWPGAFKDVSECIASSVSLWRDFNACLRVQKLAKNKDKKVAEITLENNDGKIKQTGNNIDHYSWWRADSFKIDKNIIYKYPNLA